MPVDLDTGERTRAEADEFATSGKLHKVRGLTRLGESIRREQNIGLTKQMPALKAVEILKIVNPNQHIEPPRHQRAGMRGGKAGLDRGMLGRFAKFFTEHT